MSTVAHNKDPNEAKCWKILVDLFQGIEAENEKGEFAKIGGLQNLTSSLKDFEKSYEIFASTQEFGRIKEQAFKKFFNEKVS